MHDFTRRELGAGLLAALLPFPAHAATVIDVSTHGARGDGTAIDSPAINAAIAAAASRPAGGTVFVPAGRYRRFSIRLRSRLDLATAAPDARPAIVAEDVAQLEITRTPFWRNSGRG